MAKIVGENIGDRSKTLLAIYRDDGEKVWLFSH